MYQAYAKIANDTFDRIFPELTRSTNLQEFIKTVILDPFVPVEQSPLGGQSLTDLTTKGGLIGLGSLLESFGLMHHDPIIVIATPFAIVVVGASAGAGEGLRERLRRLFSSVR